MQATATINVEQLFTPKNNRNGYSQHKKNGQNGNGRHPFIKLLEQYEFPRPQRGDIMQGEILRIDDDVLFVDVGAKRDAMVPFEEVSRLDEELLENLTRGDEVPVYVIRTPIGDEQLLVSLERGLQKIDWERAETIQGKDKTIELKAINYNKGGLVVEFGRLQGFVPNSHIPAIRNQYDQQIRQKYKAKQIGDTYSLKIIEVDAKQDRLVLSATAAQKENRLKRLRALAHGQITTGKVVNIKEYGAFVDIGDGLTGLLHISRISWQHLNHPTEELSVGEEIEVMVDEVDTERERISLDRKVLLPNPWDQFVQTHKAGDVLEGEVASIVEFGAFIKFPEGIEGLLHQSEINIPRDSDIENVLQVKDEILVRIIDIDQGHKRMSLSMRRVSTMEEVLWMSTRNQENAQN